METPKVKQIANLTKFIHNTTSKRENPNRFRLYDITGVSPTISCMSGGGLEPLVLLEMENEAKINIVGKWSQNSESNGNVYDADGLSPTITCGAHGGCEPRIRVGAIRGRGERNMQTLEVKDEMVTNTLTSVQKDNVLISDFRIRKLTERECFRLMGVREDDIDKLLKSGIGKTRLYKLAGNSIVCDVMADIFTNLFLTEDKSDALSDLW